MDTISTKRPDYSLEIEYDVYVIVMSRIGGWYRDVMRGMAPHSTFNNTHIAVIMSRLPECMQ